jgi:hypothetical protein
MASERLILRDAAIAGANLSEAQQTLVTINAEGAVVPATSSTPAWVLVNNPTTGEAATLAFVGIAKVKLGEAVSAGERIASNNSGLAVKWTTGQYPAGLALESGVAGQVISVLVPAPAKA